jgi:gliding motility-associated-like protein
MRTILSVLFALVFIGEIDAQISSDSLILNIPFNGNASDVSGNNFNGVVNGASLTTGPDGQPNTAYDFNGIDNSIVFPNISKLDKSLKEFTILIRLQPRGIIPDPGVAFPYWTTYLFLLWHRNSIDSVNAFFQARMRTGWQPPSTGTLANNSFLSYMMYWCSVSTASGYQKDTALVENQWISIAYVYKEGHLRVYHNCTLENDWKNMPAINDLCGTGPVQITLGNVPKGAFQYGYRNFKGKIDELRVYTRELSENEVKLFVGDLCKGPLQPEIKITTDPCYPNRIKIEDATDTVGYHVYRRKWQLSNGDTSDLSSLDYSFQNTGRVSVRLQLFTPNGAFSKDTALVINSVGAKKFLLVDQGLITLCNEHDVQVQLAGGMSYKWEPCTYLNDCTSSSPVIKPLTDMDYNVFATDGSGCIDTAAVHVSIVKDGNPVYVPTVFTPNGDGKNDRFGISSTQLLQEFRLQIFNRWGECVFTTEKFFEKWDGTVKGRPLPSGVYVWTLHYNSGAGCGIMEKKGTVMLIR